MDPSDILKHLADVTAGSSDLGQEELMAMMGAMMQGSDLSIGGLIANHPVLCKLLSEVTLFSALRYIGGLETVPELQKNGVRLSVLLHLAYACCKGMRQATTSDLLSWLECLDESPTQSQEDPTEDVFVGYICSSEGGFRVFPGIMSHCDFILERLLRFLVEKREFPTFGDAADSVLELLKLSEAIADDLDLPRYLSCDVNAEGRLVFPPESKAELHAQAVTFNRPRLDELKINRGKLSPFVGDDSTLAGLSEEGILGSSIERFPLFETNGEIVVSSPALLCRAGAKLVLETAKAMGGWADTFFEKESAEYFINEVIPPLGIKPIRGIDLPKPSSALPSLYAYTGQFDCGMPVLALTYSSALSRGSNLEEFEKIGEEQVPVFSEYLSSCCRSLEKIEGFKGGMILMALSGVGRAIGVALDKRRSAWRFYTSSLSDWRTLVSVNEVDARRLWYLGLQESLAEEAGVRLMNTAGLINLYGFWKEREFTFIPADMDLKKSAKLLSVDGSFSKIINADFKNRCDRHCRWHPIESCLFEVQRVGDGLNPDISQNLRYGHHGSARKGVLRGCVAKGSNVWWVELTEDSSGGESFDLVYRLWDCVISWCERLMLHLEDKYLAELPEEIVIELNLPNADNWNLNKITEGTFGADSFKCEKAEITGLVVLTINESFLGNFFQPKNVAERRIVTALVDVLVSESKEVREKLTTEVLKNENTRFFHVLMAQSLEGVLVNGPAKPLFVPDEEFWRTGIGLAFTVRQSPQERITDRKEATGFLGSVVAKLQERISAKLKKLAILPIVSHAFSQLDELSRDSTRWDLSMRALLALEDGADWLFEHLRTSKGKSVKAEIANRILIETACYSCVSTEKTIPSRTEILTILAEIAVMIQLAEYRAAVASGLVEANLKIHPNGQIEFSDSFREEVMQPYLTSRVDDGIHYHAEAYEDHFVRPAEEGVQDEDQERTLAKFEEAFIAEYGFGLDSLNKIIEVFSEFALKTGQAGGTIGDNLLRQLFKHGVGFTDLQIERFLTKFTLPMRSGWNKELPTGCEDNDVLPWRFFRGLSVLVRPFVEVSKSPRCFAISATHLERWRTYLVRSICNGELPDRIFESRELKAYLGDIAQKEGEEFEHKVATGFVESKMISRQGVKMRELGRSDADPSNDVDVLAWGRNSPTVFLVECKNLKRTLTVAQAIQQLEDFRGDPDNPKDYLTKHINRVDWLRQNPQEVSEITGIPADEIRWEPLLITSGRVPMSYCDLINFKRENVWPLSELKDKLTNS